MKDKWVQNNPDPENNTIATILKNEEGLIIGEVHSDDAARKQVIENLDNFVGMGVKSVYLEAIRSDYQSMVDDYLKLDGELSPELQRFLINKTKKDNYSYLDLLKAIKAKNNKEQADIRVIGIDSPAASTRPYSSVADRERAREATMNIYAMKVIKDSQNSGKYIALVGNAHLETQTDKTDKEEDKNTLGFDKGVPGLSEMLSVPAVAIRTEVKMNFNFGQKGE
ncbi:MULTISPECIES: hypothetical protein [unclassified Moorena]|uniref:hypothetical protein n=1 Tax=unclassified Moorena TaxID=2683338 RepID=UPI0013BCE3C5|nr:MULTISPECIES: hypothetical protein [unclassified Moorena]NEP35622.1 hypothetical protein [Moorena sp. SIO3B2]NEQ11247.1 hypothetical protein [Moorena sp. SIO4E2]NET67083.1 hypothetical protein [Moorena sp. SIO1G6]